MNNLNLNPNYVYPNNLNTQTGYNPAYGQYSPNMQGMEAIKAKAKDNAVAQYDVASNPLVMLKNFALCMLMSMGFTGATNWLMSSKKIADSATNAQDFTQTRLYKFGDKIDNTLSKSKFGTWVGRQVGKVKNMFAKIPVPKFIKEIHERTKIGSFAVLDKQGMYSLGKGAEALSETMEFLTSIPPEQIKNLGLKPRYLRYLDRISELVKTGKMSKAEAFERIARVQRLGLKPRQLQHLERILELVKTGKIQKAAAFDRIAKAGYLSKLSAKKLAKLTVGKVTFLDKLFGTSSNINLSLHKARFFNGMYNKAQGPFAKLMQKFTSLVGEASGGGVLGGKMALVMNAFGLMTGFNAASNAEKGDKLKAFMEDYIGLTLGSYLMSFVVGTWFNKFLGVTELGLDKNAVTAVGKKLGVDMKKCRLQDVVVAYNKEYRNFDKLTKIADQLRKGKIDPAKAASKLSALNINVPQGAKSLDILNAINSATQGKNAKYFAGIKKEIKNAFKSKLTIKSIFKETAENSGNFLTRLGRYVVQKPLSLIGRTLSIGRYDMVGGVGKTMGALKWAKRFGGGLGRAFLVGVVLVEPFRKGFMKLSHAIFGKPKNSVLDEDKESEKPQEQNPINSNSGQQIPRTQTGYVHNANTNILNNIMGQPLTHQQPVSDNKPLASNVLKTDESGLPEVKRTYIPSPTPFVENPTLPETKRTYVPSTLPFVEAMPQENINSQVQLACYRADAAEREAQAMLAQKF